MVNKLMFAPERYSNYMDLEKNNMKKTKKNYETMLNEMYSSVCETTFMILGKKYHGEYGTLLRKHDPIAFHLGYKSWAKFN